MQLQAAIKGVSSKSSVAFMSINSLLIIYSDGDTMYTLDQSSLMSHN